MDPYNYYNAGFLHESRISARKCRRFRTQPSVDARLRINSESNRAATVGAVMSFESESISTNLLAGLRGNKLEGWKRLMALFAPTVCHWARQQGLQEADATDVTQEVFLSVFKRIDEFERTCEKHTFRGWLYSITRRKVLDHFRKLKKTPTGRGGASASQWLLNLPDKPEIDAVDPDPEGTARGLAQRGLELIRSDFEPRTWRAFHAVVMDGRPASDVAAESGMTVGAIHAAKCRIMKRLREEFGGWVL